MVWTFCVGMVLGFPVGCYLRETGYTKKMRNAYHALNPNADEFPTDNLEKLMPNQKRDKFYKDLEKGLAKPSDFERYIYGGNYDRKFGVDN